MHRKNAVSGLLAFLLISAIGSVVWADDFLPPPWPRPSAPNPQAITAEWEFLTPATPVGPDGALTDLTFASGTAPGGTFAAISGPGPFWAPGTDGDGLWSFPGGGIIHFELDNVLDMEPVKHIWMQVTHSAGTVLDVDPLAPFNGAATGSLPDTPLVTPIDPLHTLITWNMFPNPPWEQFELVILSDSHIDQVVIDTISIPEPSTLLLGALGLVALTLIARRRPRR